MANRRLAVIAASGHGIRCDGCKALGSARWPDVVRGHV